MANGTDPHAVANGTDPHAAASGTQPQPAAADPDAGQDVLAGAAVLRSLPRLTRLDACGETAASFSGTRFLLTGDRPGRRAARRDAP